MHASAVSATLGSVDTGLDCACEKVSDGVNTLAVGIGPIKERLVAAYTNSVVRAPTPVLGVDPGLNARIGRLHERMTARDEVGGEGKVLASVNAMTDSDAAECAQEIYEIDFLLNVTRREP